MSLPDSPRTFCVQLPADEPAVGVTSQKARVAAHYVDAVDLGSVAAKYVAGLGGATDTGGVVVVVDVKGHATGVVCKLTDADQGSGSAIDAGSRRCVTTGDGTLMRIARGSARAPAVGSLLAGRNTIFESIVTGL